jgi:hypothetical protein
VLCEPEESIRVNPRPGPGEGAIDDQTIWRSIEACGNPGTLFQSQVSRDGDSCFVCFRLDSFDNLAVSYYLQAVERQPGECFDVGPQIKSAFITDDPSAGFKSVKLKKSIRPFVPNERPWRRASAQFG